MHDRSGDDETGPQHHAGFELITSLGSRPSPARVRPPERGTVRVGAVQTSWHADDAEHLACLAAGIELAARAGAQLVCLQELTLSPYFAMVPDGPRALGVQPEPLPGGPTHRFAAEQAARHGVVVHASLYEANASAAAAAPGEAELGFNTAIAVAPDGELLASTRKLHLPVTAGYYEDRYFAPGDTGYPVADVGPARVGLPTCWDQWFSEPPRAYSLAGADLLVYPTAIGSEPDHPSFDTRPLWQQVIVGNGIANGLTMVAVNRIGTERAADLSGAEGGTDTAITFYGSSFISDPYGRVLVQAPRDGDAVLVADVDLDARRDWLELFPLLATRRPDTYGPLTELAPATGGPGTQTNG
ncbi:MAG: nitrilase-related carbon-nitrogen hydrolase [Microthrixaceae bacterium]